MVLGSLVAGLALTCFSLVQSAASLFVVVLVAEGAGMFVLYNVAFASVTRLESPISSARAISIITLLGGIASTVFWPLTLRLETTLGWQNTSIVLGVLVLVVCVP